MHEHRNHPRSSTTPHGKNLPQRRLKFEKSFFATIQPIKNPPEIKSINGWKEREKNSKREIK